MSAHYTLRGGCQCGRNHYYIQPPADATQVARVLFDAAPTHRSSLASPIPAFLRVPLAWYHSSTTAFFDDESPAMIHRVYEEPLVDPADATTSAAAVAAAAAPLFTQRHFCGFCGTPLSFWSEAPRSEANYIRLVLGSLQADDLHRLDDWGAIDDAEEGEADVTDAAESADADNTDSLVTSSTGLPWLDRFVEGSRLGRQLLRQQLQLQLQQRRRSLQPIQSTQIPAARVRRHEGGAAASADGTVQVEWEVLEWTEGDDDAAGTAGATGSTPAGVQSPAKRPKYDDDGGSGSSGGGGVKVSSSSPMDVEPSSGA